MYYTLLTFQAGSHSVIPLTTYSESVAMTHTLSASFGLTFPRLPPFRAFDCLLSGALPWSSALEFRKIPSIRAINRRPDMAASSSARWLVSSDLDPTQRLWESISAIRL